MCSLDGMAQMFAFDGMGERGGLRLGGDSGEGGIVPQGNESKTYLTCESLC